MRLKQQRQGSLPFVIVRAFGAVVLALAILATAVPRSSATSIETCTMSCCAGMPAHLAGSCHSEVAVVPKKQEAEPEVLCGLQAITIVAEPTVETDTGQPACGMHDESAKAPRDDDARGDSANFRKNVSSPCSQDCSSSLPASARQQRSRDASRHSVALVGPENAPLRLHRTRYGRIAGRSLLSPQLQPRAPPSVFS